MLKVAMSYLKQLFLIRIRLSTYFWAFFALYFTLSYVIPGYKFESGSLTLFSVNSFLYGFYISPILAAQKARIDSLHQIIRAEANAMFSLMLDIKKLPKHLRTELQSMIMLYMHAKLRQKGINGGEKQYEALITYCVDYKGQDTDKVDAVLADLVANQKNRTDFNMQAANKVYANEWQIMAILFGITLGFVMTLSVDDDSLILHVVRALLCTGLTMLVVILVKLNSLTHKRAKLMWRPLEKLVQSNFYQID
ncbi:MAG TPA: hypothetical protein VGE30_00050 [Candidatus Saccharimonadales bacterium]